MVLVANCGVLGQHARPAPTPSSSENISFFSELNRQIHSVHRTEPMHLYRNPCMTWHDK